MFGGWDYGGGGVIVGRRERWEVYVVEKVEGIWREYDLERDGGSD